MMPREPSCEEVMARLFDYLDRQLEAPDRAVIERHLRRVDPTLRGTALRLAVQQAFDSYARYYVESFRLPSLSKRAVDRPFTVDGFHHITEALEGGKGCIFALPHLGGWEWAGRWMTDRGHRLTVVVEALDPPELFEWFADLRKDLGMTVVPTGPKAGPAVLKALRDNEIVCLLCDRDLERNGVSVDFFGIAVPSTDRLYDAKGSLDAKRVLTWPLSTGLNVGW